MAQPNNLRQHNGIHPSLGEGVFIDDHATVIGDVSLADDVSVWPGAIIRGDMHSIRIGKRCSVQDGAVLHITHKSEFNPSGWPLVIGDDVTIGHQACLHGCVIGNRVLVGIHATVLDGAIVPDDVIIGAGALVPPQKHLESGFLYIGSPCKKSRPLSEKELNFFRYSAQNYVDLKNQYLAEQQP
ncbi:MAG: carbonic anhydrase/acetyltransferase-like protein (isoleucine patch superfamily) [Flavobacteriales bacterium]